MNRSFLIIDASQHLDFSLLTKHRVPAAIPFFGKYRLIDINLSNAMNSSVSNVSIFTSYSYRSLIDHIGSGARYDLNRRRDGIFILPPKNQVPVKEEFLSFMRMSEQLEYFNRSLQEYVIIIPSTLAWSPDFNDLLDEHIKSNKSISEIINNNNERLYSFIMSKEFLMKYITSYKDHGYRYIKDVFDYSNESKNTIIYNRYAKYIKDYKEYFNITIDMLKDLDNNILYKMDNLIRTKEPLNDACYYGEDAILDNAYISSGSRINGEIKTSILSRRVTVSKGAKVINSIILNNSIIEENAYIENAILDKESVVKKNARIIGDIDNPFVSEKRQIIGSSSLPNVLMISAECSPFIKRGGLADMVGSLSKELANENVNTYVFLPLYKEIKDKYISSLIKDKEIKIEIENKEYHINSYIIEEANITYCFIDLYMFFDRDEVYGYDDDQYRFAYFSKAVLEYIRDNNLNIDIIHAHDWHASLIPLLLKKYKELSHIKTILTIHNLNYQGETNKEIINHFKLDYEVFGNTFNFLEAGINTFDIITTVSKTYQEELKYIYYSGNLRDSIVRRSSDLYGIVNGLDNKFNPENDLDLKAKYNKSNVKENKLINKKFLCEKSGFKYHDDMFIMGMVSRINEDKGFSLIIDSIDDILKNDNIYLVLLGVGDEYIMNKLRDIENRYRGRVKLFLDYFGINPSYIYSGADVFLMPSRIEPCGTSQMIALKYGTIPIVRQTGGLNDTIEQFDRLTKRGNGFKFFNYHSYDLINSINIAYDSYINKDEWNSLIINAMNSDNSFNKCVKEYINVYNNLMEK